MDASAEKMMDFAIIPIETLIACRCILNEVFSIITRNISSRRVLCSQDIDALSLHYRQAREVFDSGHTVWPLIVKQQSRIYDIITRLVENATEWLERSAFSAMFAEHGKNLKKYLKPQRGFSASGLAVRGDGTVLRRELIILEQRAMVLIYKKNFDQLEFYGPQDQDMQNFENFLMVLTWAREQPLGRMFSKAFSGTYLEHVPQVQNDPVSDHVSLAGT
ncbi:hypothetical protein J4E83_008567 [Alternaria metachromatica]|uniref:uncharacterized protein n=1 Tax=Alternaria metachromatica TaxID=283354 RepID=UPI0020C37AC6|nr:uncharacterized protein J4E83_008567 [Alternaria metachromatica]KAI4610002.1 hypothetical protein J4E83_008567 [Alternaria metachromatica]